MILSTAPQRRGFSRVSASSAARGGSRWRLNKRCQLLSEIRILAIVRTCLCSVSFTRGARGGLRGRGRPRPPREFVSSKTNARQTAFECSSFPRRAPRERLSTVAWLLQPSQTARDTKKLPPRGKTPSVGSERDHWVHIYTYSGALKWEAGRCKGARGAE